MEFQNFTALNSTASEEDLEDIETEFNKTLSFGILNTWTKYMKTYEANPNHVPWDFLSEEQQEKILFGLMGHKRMGFTRSVIITVIYAILLLVGFTGNFLTCIIILFNSYMRVPANFFLFSLAIADIITLVGGNFLLFTLMSGALRRWNVYVCSDGAFYGFVYFY